MMLSGCFVEQRYELRCEEVGRSPAVVAQGQAGQVSLTVTCEEELVLHDWMLASSSAERMPASEPLTADRERGRDFVLRGVLSNDTVTPLDMSDLEVVATNEEDLRDVLVVLDWTVSR